MVGCCKVLRHVVIGIFRDAATCISDFSLFQVYFDCSQIIEEHILAVAAPSCLQEAATGTHCGRSVAVALLESANRMNGRDNNFMVEKDTSWREPGYVQQRGDEDNGASYLLHLYGVIMFDSYSGSDCG